MYPLLLLVTLAADPQPVSRDDLDITSGEVKQTASGFLTVVGPQERAQLKAGNHSLALLQFRYRGKSEKTEPLDGGDVVHQIGLKLRAMNTCNLLYVMWRIEPKEEIVISIKRNPGKTTHAQCGAGGYNFIARIPLTKLNLTATDQQTHRLQAKLEKKEGTDLLAVTIDGQAAWSGPLPAALMADLQGPVGFRSDNGSFIFKLLVAEE